MIRMKDLDWSPLRNSTIASPPRVDKMITLEDLTR